MLWIAIAETSHDELGQVARSPAPAARAKAGGLVVALEDLTKGSDLDPLHGPSMMREWAQGGDLGQLGLFFHRGLLFFSFFPLASSLRFWLLWLRRLRELRLYLSGNFYHPNFCF